MFDSHDELANWAQRTGREVGHVLVRRRSNTNAAGVVNKITIMCERGGKRDSRLTGPVKLSRKIDCPFRLVGRLTRDDSWTVDVIDHRHNHPWAISLEGHAYARRMSDAEKQFVDRATDLGYYCFSIFIRINLYIYFL